MSDLVFSVTKPYLACRVVGAVVVPKDTVSTLSMRCNSHLSIAIVCGSRSLGFSRLVLLPSSFGRSTSPSL